MLFSTFKTIHLAFARRGLAILVAVLATSPAWAVETQRPGGSDKQQLARWWNDLEEDEAIATQALLKLSAHPQEAVPFLKTAMRPLIIEPQRVTRLLEALASDDDGVWEPAYEELEYFDPRLAFDLDILMAEVRAAPVRQRVVEIMSGGHVGSLAGKEIQLRNARDDGFNFFSPQIGSWWAEHKVIRINSTSWGNRKKKWTRAVRGINLLAQIGTPTAVSILKKMAQGHHAAEPTRMAAEAVTRLAATVGAVPGEPIAVDRKQLETWWIELEHEEAVATQAILKLAAHPREAIAFLQSAMKPLFIKPERVFELLEKLASEDAQVWQPAYRELEYFDPRLAINLETLMSDVTESPARQRLVEILSGREVGTVAGQKINLQKAPDEGFNFSSNNESWWAEHRVARLNNWGSIKKKWTRAVRAIILLGHIATPDAIAILNEMTTGHPDAQLTKVALDITEKLAGPAQ